MGSRVGYEYRHRGCSMVDVDEILKSRYTSCPLPEGFIAFIFEIRTNFVILRRSTTEEEEEKRHEETEGFSPVFMDSEIFDTCLPLGPKRHVGCLFVVSCLRLMEYWMTRDEIKSFCDESLDFARRIAADPQHASRNLFPIVVRLDVCTVQQEGEPFDATKDRAIMAKKLVPIYISPGVPSVGHKFVSFFLMDFLNHLPKIRVADAESMSLMPVVCCICKRSACIGDQISSLPSCKHTFHSHCIFRWLEDDNLCPTCHFPAYDPFYLSGSYTLPPP